jgi:hypothetical protein
MIEKFKILLLKSTKQSDSSKEALFSKIKNRFFLTKISVSSSLFLILREFDTLFSNGEFDAAAIA